jgi:SAM-dependent methyltransferase
MDPGRDLSQAASYWDEMTAQYITDGVSTRRAEWQTHPATIAHRRRLLGDRSADEWLIAKLPGRVERGFGAGCGIAEFELRLLASGAVGHFDLCDVSRTSLDSATKRAEQLGVADRITVRCGDMLAADDGDYDLVTFVSSLHHAVDVVATVRFAHDLVGPGGILYADEYIGPRRFAYAPEHADLVKTIYRSLAPELRGPWPELPQPDPADVAEADPTEAAQSDLILDALCADFAEVELAPIYGALPFILWWGLNHDALWDTPDGREFTKVLLALDAALGSSGALPCYFSLIVARNSRES